MKTRNIYAMHAIKRSGAGQHRDRKHESNGTPPDVEEYECSDCALLECECETADSAADED